MRNRTPDIKYLFEPGSIAVIGASQDTGKLGFKVFNNIISGGFKGRVYPVNPRGGEIQGHSVYKSIEEIKDEIDIVCTVIPEKLVFDSVKSSAGKGVKFNLIITSGFSEVGKRSEENDIVAYAREHGMRIIGPNIFGIYSSAASINATFGPGHVKPGSLAVITQSGAIGISMMGKTVGENIGLSSIISVGNKSDIDESDLLEYLIDQDQTAVILMYIEGVSGGERLIKMLRKTTKKKPVVVIKSGRSRRGAMAAASHTGSLAGEDAVFDDIIRQCDVIRAEGINEGLNWCNFLANAPKPKGENTVIVTNGGGIGVLATDACEKYKVNLYDNLPDLKKTFSSVIPEFGSAKNPIDVTGQASTSYYDIALDAALKNRNIDAIICLACQTAVFDHSEFARIVQKRFEESRSIKPVVFSYFGGVDLECAMEELKKVGVPAYPEVYESVSALGAMFSYYRNKSHRAGDTPGIELDLTGIKEIINKARADKRTSLFPYESQALMKMIGVSTPKSIIAHNLEEAVKYAAEIGYPVVMKIVSRDILHKSDAGGVALDLQDENELMDAYQAVTRNARAYNPMAVIEGVEVAEMIQFNIETIIGARRDRSFGPIVMFGLGGIYVEVMKDISFRSYPLGRRETMKMISQIRSYPLLLGVRGEKRKDIDAVADTIIKLGALVHQVKAISDIEINPLVVYDQGEGVRAVDVRILLTAPQEVK